MLKRKRISLLIFLILISSSIFSVFIYANNGDFPDFTGSGHEGCHNNTPAYLSSSGYFDVVLSSGNTVTTDEVFTITLSVRNFTESAGENLHLGFPNGGGRGDNSLWQTDGGLFDSTQHNGVDINASGDSSGELFILTAPSSTGSYTLVADAIHDEPDGGGADELVYVTVNIALTVVIADSSAPSVAITAPSNNAYVSGSSVLIDATADDGSGVGVDTVWAEITNATYSDNVSMSGTEPDYSGTWDSTVVFDGTYTLAVKANDTADNLNNTESITIKVDNTAPSITIDSVIPDPSNGATTITASNSSSDIDGNGIRANITNPSSGETYVNLIYQGSNIWNGTFTVTQNGNYDIYINATDFASNTATVGPTSITGDVSLPTITLTVTPNPSNGITTIQAFNFTEVISGSLLANVSTPSGFIYPILTYQGADQWTGSFDVSTYGDGLYTININGTDLAGNVQYNSTSITGDITLPSVTITSPTEGENVGGAISITGTATGTGSNIANIFINNSIWGDSSQKPQTDTAIGNPSGSFTFNNKSYIAPGNYWVEINITDDAGNVNSSIRYFVVTTGDSTPPNIIITVSADPSNGFTNITVISNEDLDAGGPPLLNITLPDTTVIYRQLYLIATRTWQTNYTVGADGTYTIAVNATDISLNIGFATKNFEGDITPPTITLTTTPDPSNGITTIQAFNTTEVISGSLLANVSAPSGYIYPILIYQGANQWTGTFNVESYGDGLYTINVNGTDLAGNVGYAIPVDITGDLTGPTITLVVTPDPSNGITNIQAFNTTEVISGSLLANVSTPSGYIYPTLTYQGVNQWTGTFDVGSYGDGLYTINVNGTDLAGNVDYAIPVDITGDLTAPTIILTVTPDPSNGITTIQAFNTTEVISGILLANVSTPSGYIYPTMAYQGTNQWTGSFDVNTYGDGHYTINVNGTDLVGNVGYATPTNITGDLSSPIITINQPTDSQIFGETAPIYNISISETNFDSAWYTLDGGITNNTIVGSNGMINQELWDFIPNGNVTIRFYANDTLGHIGLSEVTIEKDVLDTQGPIITGLIESNDPSELGQPISIQVNILDISNISSVQIELKGIKYNMTSVGGDIYNYQWIPVNVENLLYTIYANDTVGNSNLIFDSVTIQDTTLPTFSNLFESTDLVDPGDSIIITLDVTDISGINETIISFEGTDYIMTNVGGDTWSYALTAPDTPGVHYYTIYIEDNNNNINSVEGSIIVSGTVSGTTGEPTDVITIPIFLGIIGVLTAANIALIVKKIRGGRN